MQLLHHLLNLLAQYFNLTVCLVKRTNLSGHNLKLQHVLPKVPVCSQHLTLFYLLSFEHLALAKGSTQDIGSLHPQIFLRLYPLTQYESLLFSRVELQHGRQRDHEQGHNEHTPKGNDDTHNSPDVGLWVEVSIPHSCHRHKYIPNRVREQVEVLLRSFGHWSLKHAQAVAHLSHTHQQHYEQHSEWLGFHQRFYSKHVVSLYSIHMTTILFKKT